MKIMIVDDHSGIREMLRSLLACPGIELSECADGAEALGAYHDFRPDWVFMDVEMGDNDGLTATREICNAYPEARVVIVTKHSGEAMREAASDAGACAYVLKENLLDLRELLTVKTQTLNLNET